MKHQIGNDTVVRIGWIIIFIQPADPIGDFWVSVFFVCFLYHFFAQVDAQHLLCTAFHRIFTVPAVTAPKIEYAFAAQIRKQGFELMPFSCSG